MCRSSLSTTRHRGAASLSSCLDHSQLKEPSYLVPILHPKTGKLDSWMLSDFQNKPDNRCEEKTSSVKIICRWVEDRLRSYTGFVILLKCIWFSSHSTNRNANTSYRKEKHTCNISERNNMWSSWMYQTPSLTGSKFVKCPTPCCFSGTLTEWNVVLKVVLK